MEVTVTVEIDAPRPRVFEVFNDYEHIADRISGIKAATVHTPGPARVGTSWTETRELYGREASETMTIATFDPPNGLTVTAESHGNKYASYFTFEDTEGGGTRVAMRFTGTPQTFMARVMGFVMGRVMLKSIVGLLEKDMQDLKAFIEGAE